MSVGAPDCRPPANQRGPRLPAQCRRRLPRDLQGERAAATGRLEERCEASAHLKSERKHRLSQH
eukprot:6295306-Pyramimonas_sp.AAC.1